MSTITKEEVSTQVEDILGYPYMVILHNDDFNSFDHVIECMIKICKHDFETASQIAHLVHFTGKCDVKRGNKEEMTIIYKKLKSASLTVTLETT
jgi:ATP-dependent Clp protease adaptor protein ClpS